MDYKAQNESELSPVRDTKNRGASKKGTTNKGMKNDSYEDEQSQLTDRKSRFNENLRNSQKQSLVSDSNEMERNVNASLNKQKETFLTQSKQADYNPSYSLHDMLFPAGKLAKLCKIKDPEVIINIPEILLRFKITDSEPVIILAGAKEADRSKFYAGICRAAFRTDAIIIDSGIANGIEPFVIRRKVRLIGVAPEGEVQLPKINPTQRDWNELANGHTHLFLLGGQLGNTEKKVYKWEDESKFKFNLALNIAHNKTAKKNGRPRCKIVTVVMGDHEKCATDIINSVKHDIPIIIVKGSSFCSSIMQYMNNQISDIGNESLTEALGLDNAHVYILENNNSEEIASYLHFFLTVTPYQLYIKKNTKKAKRSS